MPALNGDDSSRVLLSELDEADVAAQAASLGMNADELSSLQALAHRMSITTMSTAYSGIDSPGTAVLQIIGALTERYGLQVEHPQHLFAIEWEDSCQHELRLHPGSAECIFGDITYFLHPLLRHQLPDLHEKNQLSSVLMPVVRDTPHKAIIMTLA